MTLGTIVRSVILPKEVIITVIMTYNGTLTCFRKLDIREETQFQSMFQKVKHGVSLGEENVVLSLRDYPEFSDVDPIKDTNCGHKLVLSLSARSSDWGKEQDLS